MTQYHRFLKNWTTERGITSFLGSDKPAFQQDWKEEKKGGLRFSEIESMGGEDINRAGEPFKKPKPERSAAEAVFTNPDLLKQIGAFTNPKRQLKINDFFLKNKDGNEQINDDVVYDFLLERGMDSGMYKGKAYLKDHEQYKKLLDILAKIIYDMKSFDDTEYRRKYKGQGGYGEGYQEYNQKIRIPVMRQLIANLLEQKLPTDFDYDKFWTYVSNVEYPIMTRINNVQMKKLFSNWKNKGKRYKVTFGMDSRDVGFV
jgi:hypothetical protein